MTLTLSDAMGPIVDAFLMQLYFSTAQDEKNISRTRKALSFLLLLPLVLLASRGLGIHTLLRFILRVVLYALYLFSAKGILGQRGLFLAIFAASCSTAGQNIFLSPLVDSLLDPLGLPRGSPWLMLALSTVIRLLIILPLCRLLPMDHIGEPTLSSWLSLMMTVFCIMLTRELRWNGLDISGTGNLVFILLQVFMLLFLIVLEREAYQTKLEREGRVQNAINEERLKVYEYQYKADAEVRFLRHDIKNHLLALRSMAGEGENERLRSYLDDILEQTGEELLTIETGNHTLDGLLSQKAIVLRDSSIRFDIILDFRDINFISDMDLCTIFGNAIDNAIEACRKVKDREKRYICIHSERMAGQLIVNMMNSYDGDIQMKNGLPVTSKKDPRWHGIGLSSIRKTVRKYDGVAEMDLSVPEQFSLTILIPLPPDRVS